jgi:hypothetical protein
MAIKCRVLCGLWPLFKICAGPTEFPVPSCKEIVGKTISHIKHYKTKDRRATIMVILKLETDYRWLYRPADNKCGCSWCRSHHLSLIKNETVSIDYHVSLTVLN